MRDKSSYTESFFNNSANMSRISLTFGTETLNTTKKNFHFKHFHSGLLAAGLLCEVEAELEHKWQRWCPQRCTSDVIPRLHGEVGEKLISTKLSGFVDRSCAQKMSAKFKLLFKIIYFYPV